MTNREQSPKMAQGAYEKEHVMQVNNAIANGRRLPIPHTAIGAAARSSVTPLPAVRATLYLAVMYTAFIISFSIVNNLSSTKKKHREKIKPKVTVYFFYLLFYVMETAS